MTVNAIVRRLGLGVLMLSLLGCSHSTPPPKAGSPAAGKSATASATSPADIMVTTLSSVPGKRVQQTEGLVCRMFVYQGTGDYGDRMSGAIATLRKNASKDHMDAVINIRVTAASFAAQGSGWASSEVNVCGDAVKLD